MQVDITVNNILAIVNTKLLADYVKLDERLLQLCCVVKHWAKRRQARPPPHKRSSMHTFVMVFASLDLGSSQNVVAGRRV